MKKVILLITFISISLYGNSNEILKDLKNISKFYSGKTPVVLQLKMTKFAEKNNPRRSEVGKGFYYFYKDKSYFSMAEIESITEKNDQLMINHLQKTAYFASDVKKSKVAQPAFSMDSLLAFRKDSITVKKISNDFKLYEIYPRLTNSPIQKYCFEVESQTGFIRMFEYTMKDSGPEFVFADHKVRLDYTIFSNSKHKFSPPTINSFVRKRNGRLSGIGSCLNYRVINVSEKPDSL